MFWLILFVVSLAIEKSTLIDPCKGMVASPLPLDKEMSLETFSKLSIIFI
jgi:hypothetical protein